MAYSEQLADRIRGHLAGEAGGAHKARCGGPALLINGKMGVSASGQGGLLLRVEPGQTEQLAGEPHARPFVMRGREMDGWLRVDTDSLDSDADFAQWVGRGVAYARTLPPK